MYSRKVLLIISAMLAVCASASEGYKCTSKQILQRLPDGTLGSGSMSKMLMRMNTEFVVDRTSGRMIGSKGFSNHNEGYGVPKVIDPGSSEQSFKVLTMYSPHTSVAYLQIEEYREGKAKPFSFFDGLIVVAGTCSPY